MMAVAALAPQSKLVIPSWLIPRRISETDMHRLMRQVLASREAEGIAWLKRVWSAQRDGITVAEIEVMLSQGIVPPSVLDAVRKTYQEFIAGKLSELMNGAAADMGAGWARGAGFAFDASTVRLLDVIASRANVNTLPVDLMTAQQEALDIVIRYFTQTEAAPAGTIANIIRQFIGLTKRDAGVVLNLRTTLKNAGFPPAVVNSRVANYTDYLRQVRALRIARTELAYAANAGKAEAVQQAIDNGYLTGEVVREWSTAEDEAVCPICAPLDAVTAPLHGVFDPGGYEAPPAHPNCRCVTIEIELLPKG